MTDAITAPSHPPGRAAVGRGNSNENNPPAPPATDWKAKDLGPTPRETRILRRIGSAGGLQLVFRKTRIWFYFADDMPAGEINFALFRKFWIVPDPSVPALFQDALAQAYLAAPIERQPEGR